MGRISLTLLLLQQIVLAQDIDPTYQHRTLRNANQKEDRMLRGDDDGSMNVERNLQKCSAQFELDIQFDAYAYEVSWMMFKTWERLDGADDDSTRDDDGYYFETVWGESYGNTSWNNGNVTERDCIPRGIFNFTIFDSAGDGLCCDFGLGYYELRVDGAIITKGGDFGSEELTSFKVFGSPTVSPAPTNQASPTAAPSVAPTVTCNADEEVTLSVEIKPDDQSVSWNLTDASKDVILSYEFSDDDYSNWNQISYREYCIPFGVYTFTIRCEYGYCFQFGYYNISVDTVPIIQKGAQSPFYDESTTFATANAPTAAPSPAPIIQCSLKEYVFDLVIQLGEGSFGVSWNLTDLNESLVLEDSYTYKQMFDLVSAQACLPIGTYTLTIYDYIGSGLCCGGYYNVSLDGNQIKHREGRYALQEVTKFATPGATLSPTVSPEPTTLPSAWSTASPTSAPTVECASEEGIFELDMNAFFEHDEISWKLENSDSIVLLSGQNYTYGSQIVHREKCLLPGSYVFTIVNSAGSGVCCASTLGFYKLQLDGTVVKKGGPFGYNESTIIEVLPRMPTSSPEIPSQEGNPAKTESKSKTKHPCKGGKKKCFKTTDSADDE